MKAKKSSFIRGLLLAILTCIFAFALAACGDDETPAPTPGGDEKPAPTVTNVSITAAQGATLGKVDEEHVLSYTATDGSQVNVTVKKGSEAAVSGTDYTYAESTKILVFKTEGAYTVTVTATKDGKTGTGSAQITITGDVVTPTLENLAVEAEEFAGYAGVTYTVSYDVTPANANVNITVKKGTETAVAGTDYTLNDKEIVFLAKGTYKVVATPVGGTAVESDEIEIVMPSLDVTAPATAFAGANIQLTVTYTPEEAPLTVELLNAEDGLKVEASKYTYNAAQKTIVIREAGNYQVKVTMEDFNLSDTTEAIAVTVSDNPTFALNADKTTMDEGATATITRGDITYPHDDDTLSSANWDVEYSADGETYAAATTAQCDETYNTGEGNNILQLKALVAGSFKITYTVTCTGGHTGTDTVVIAVTPAELTLTSKMEGWTKIASATDLAYDVTGYAGNYTVSYSEQVLAGTGSVTKNSATEKAENSLVNVTATDAIVATYTVTYTHNSDSTKVYTLVFNVVGGAADGPAFTTNVTHNVLLPDVALKLYAGEADGATVEYTVIDSEKAQISDIANVGKAIVLKSGAEGTVRVAVVQTLAGKSSVSVQTFTVGTRGGDNAMNSYYTAVTGKTIDSGVDFAWLDASHDAAKQHEKHTLLTKAGFVFNYDNSVDITEGDMFKINVPDNGADKKNFQLEFDFTLVNRRDASGTVNQERKNNVSLAIYFVPKAGWGSPQISIYSYAKENAKNDPNSDGLYDYTNSVESKVAGTAPKFATDSEGYGYKVRVRMTRMIANGKAIYLVEWKANETDEYTTWFTLTDPVKNNDKNFGSPIERIQFTHECGSYAIENLTYAQDITLPEITATVGATSVRANVTTSVEYSLANALVGGVTMKVYSGETELASDKYTYDSEAKTISFAEAGEYKIVFTALGATTVEKEITVTPVPTVTVTLPETAKVSQTASITVTVNNSEEKASVEVKKLNGEVYEDVTEGDYTYDASGITFNAVGTYKVIASIEDGDIKGEAVIVVSSAAAPVFTVSASETSVAEGSAVTMTAGEITYDTENGDAAGDGTVTYTVLYAATGNEYAAIEENAADYYTVSGNTVTLKIAGNYRIVGSVTSQLGIVGTASAEVTATPASIELTFDGELTKNWYRMAANSTDTDITYTVTGNAANYNVTYENGKASQNTPEAGKGLVSVNWTAPNTYTVKVIYTHKTVSTAKVELVINVSAVSDLNASPILGVDPFGGTFNTLIPSTGVQLYYSATDKDGGAIADYTGVQYTIASSNLEKAAGGAHIYNAQDNALYPYLIVEDFDGNGNDATGTVTVKMTVMVDGQTAVATKVFTCNPLPKAGNSVEGINNYLKSVGVDIKNTDHDGILAQDQRQNMVVTKEGILYHRGQWGGGALSLIRVNNKDNFQVDFTYRVLKRQTDDIKASFAVNFRTGTFEGWNGSQNAFYVEKEGTTITAGYWGAQTSKDEFGSNAKPEALVNAPSGLIHVRLKHTVANNVATFLWQWSSDGETYIDWLQYTVATSTANGDMGAPVNAMQISHEAGSFILGHATVTEITVE